jgi:hypothetical protein
MSDTDAPARAPAAPASAPSSALAPAEPRKLDDVLLAMDVVDTLRHREQTATFELDAEAREAQLIARLKEIYDAQGIEVPDRILRDGVKALEEQRFAYKPPEGGLSVALARLYVRRDRWLPGLGWSLALLVAAALVAQFAWLGPRMAETRRLPAEIAELSREAQALAVDAEVDARIASLETAALGALRRGESGESRRHVGVLRDMRDQLDSEYELRVVSRPGEETGFVRIPDDAPTARNYYLVVQAIDPGGQPLRLPVANEETQETERVTRWGQRVSEATFERVARDKADDQIVQDGVLGVKRRGELTPSFREPVPGGAVTEW